MTHRVLWLLNHTGEQAVELRAFAFEEGFHLFGRKHAGHERQPPDFAVRRQPMDMGMVSFDSPRANGQRCISLDFIGLFLMRAPKAKILVIPV